MPNRPLPYNSIGVRRTAHGYDGYKGYDTTAAKPVQSVAEILSEPLGEVQPDLTGAQSSASRQRQIADMLMQRTLQQDNTSLAGGLSQLGQAWIARKAGQKADASEGKYKAMTAELMQKALAGDQDARRIVESSLMEPGAALAAQYGRERDTVQDTFTKAGLDLQGRGVGIQERGLTHQIEQAGVQNDLAERTLGLNAELGRGDLGVAQGGLALGWAELEQKREEAKAKLEVERKAAEAARKANPSGLTDAQVKTEIDLSKRWEPVQNNFADIQQQYARVKVLGATTRPDGSPMDAAQRAVNDLALVVAFTKMLDPGSVAREGEVELTKKSASLLGEAQTWLPRLQKGGTLLPEATRQALVDAAGDMMPAYEQAYQKLAFDNAGRANAYGLSPERILIGYEFAEPQTASPNDGVTAPAPAVGTEEDGYVFMGGDPADPNNWKQKPAGGDFRFFNTPGVR
jgi:hypothetical protein